LIDARLRKQDRELIPAIRIDSIRYDTIPYDTAILTWAANQLSLPHVTKTKKKQKKHESKIKIQWPPSRVQPCQIWSFYVKTQSVLTEIR